MTTPTTITLPAKLDSLYESLDFVASCARRSGFGDDRISEIELAIEEILVNIYNYAYKNTNLEGTVEITCHLTDKQSFVIRITDTGVPFDVLTVKEPDVTAKIDDRQIGGLGIFLVKRLMDDVQYRRDADKNILTLTVNRTKPNA